MLLEKEYTYFGIIKMPLRLVGVETNISTKGSDHDLPFIIEYENGKSLLMTEHNKFTNKINTHQAIVLVNGVDD